MARQFIAGKNPADVMKTLRKRHARKHRLYGRLVRRSGRERKGSGRIRGALSGIARRTGRADPRLDRSVRQRCGAFSGRQRVGKNFRALFADESGGSGGCHCASRAEAAADSASRARAGRVRELRHGELRAQKHHARTFQNSLHGTANFAIGRTPASWCRLICAIPGAICAI